MVGRLLIFMSIGLWGVLELYVFFILNRKTYKENKEKKSKLIILFCILIGIFGPLVVDPSVIEALLLPFRGWKYFSIPLILAGIIIRFSAIRQLGTAFSVNIGVLKESKLKRDGLYSLVRHPSYLGEIIIFLGVSVAFFHPVGSFFAFVFPTAAFIYRIQMEEKVLIASFGEEYRQYQKRTKKVIPFTY
ncbi:isoprenylcysteine carboxylmethyltransferase family protein [Alkalibacterium putridalgicola]|uniref:methyltransferase family protein n=1 Tax=Alkalibacterium putridalgicola TaxID=426703 RepID=UPI0034CF3DC9